LRRGADKVVFGKAELCGAVAVQPGQLFAETRAICASVQRQPLQHQKAVIIRVTMTDHGRHTQGAARGERVQPGRFGLKQQRLLGAVQLDEESPAVLATQVKGLVDAAACDRDGSCGCEIFPGGSADGICDG